MTVQPKSIAHDDPITQSTGNFSAELAITAENLSGNDPDREQLAENCNEDVQYEQPKQATKKRTWRDKVDPLKRRNIPPIPAERVVTKAYHAHFLSSLLFGWMGSLLSTGYQRPLELTDVWTVSPSHHVDFLLPRFKQALHLRKTALQSRHRHPLVLALYDCFKKDFLLSAFCILLASCLQVLTPFVLRYLITFVEEAYSGNDASIAHGVGLVVGITLMQIIQSFSQNHYYYRSMLLGAQVRSTLISCISEKSLKLSDRAKIGHDTEEGWSNGRINNLMSTDTSRLDNACRSMHQCWAAPLQILLALALLCINLSYSALVGFGLICMILPLLGRAARSLAAVRKEINKLTDKRISLTNEAFNAIRVVKIFAWEAKLEERLAVVRNAETKKMAWLLIIRNAILAAGMMTTVMATMLTFVTYYLSPPELTAAPVRSSFALFNAVGVPIENLPMAMGNLIDAYAAVKRIFDFLKAEEMVDRTLWQPHRQAAVLVEHASFTWAERSFATEVVIEPKLDLAEGVIEPKVDPPTLKTTFQLTNIDLSIGRSELVVVIGSVGAGKSSLLSALAGDMQTISGHVVFGGSRSFCSQLPWIQNTTFRQNVIFGKPFDGKRYNDVLDACALRPDLSVLPSGDATEIGERGITLSGGQKQRLSIARAIYTESDVVLLDDPLSAVDAHVGQHIMDHAICGLLRNKTRILATHQLHFLQRADRIVWLKDGTIYKTATFSDLIENDVGFQILVESTSKRRTLPSNETTSADSTSAAKTSTYQASDEDIRKPEARPLMQKEEQASGSVKLAVYRSFIQATGTLWNVLIIVLLMTAAQGLTVLTSLWLAWWTAGKWDLPVSQYIGIYAALSIAGALLMFIYAGVLTTLCTVAGRTLLRQAIAKTIRAPVSFFDTTPLGRITNRFSKDVDTVDNRLTENLCFVFFTFATIVSVFGLAIAYYYYFIVALAPLSIAFVYSAAYYRHSAREIKRHEAVLRSVVFARFGETIAGTATIRAYGAQGQFQKSIVDALDAMDGAYFLTFAGQRWLSIRLDAVGNLLIFTVGILIVTSRFEVDASIAGLVLAYMLTVGRYMQAAVHVTADVQNDFNSVERLYHYAHHIGQEATGGIKPASSWPEAGAVAFDRVEMQYRSGLPLVLKKVSFHVKAGERVGIIGRTGAGKSSIMVALFRLAELVNGSISIDDMDISELSVHDLRSRLAMIPQDPTLFKGTIRSNLDPFDEHEDLELWNALRQADLLNDDGKDKADRLTLESVVEEEGHNFSLGQRQLLALARVLVRDTRIVICDEATSSVDFETDLRVQRTMLRAFKGKTLLCIAHRLKTIIRYDRILVMESGNVADFDTPLALFDRGGIFRGMCERSGISRRDLLVSDEPEVQSGHTNAVHVRSYD